MNNNKPSTATPHLVRLHLSQHAAAACILQLLQSNTSIQRLGTRQNPQPPTLSVSTSARMSPAATSSPTALRQPRMLPAFMVGDREGMASTYGLGRDGRRHGQICSCWKTQMGRRHAQRSPQLTTPKQKTHCPAPINPNHGHSLTWWAGKEPGAPAAGAASSLGAAFLGAAAAVPPAPGE